MRRSGTKPFRCTSHNHAGSRRLADSNCCKVPLDEWLAECARYRSTPTWRVRKRRRIWRRIQYLERKLHREAV